MFIRIYSGIALSIILAMGLVYSIYQVSYRDRLTQYSESILRGSLLLISEGLQRQQSGNRSRWLELISQITGFRPQVELLRGTEKESWEMTIDHDAHMSIELKHAGQRLTLELDKIGEQQFRAIALLALNELAVSKEPNIDKTLKNVQALFPFPIKRIDDEQLVLDRQQMLRLNTGFVVVTSPEQEKRFSIFVRLPDNKILSVGPIDEFEVLTLEMLIFLVIMSILVTSSFTYYLVSRLERRLNVINLALAEFGPSKIKNRVPIEGNDVITKLGQKANDMADRIENLLDYQKEMTQAVSHELRTPIARIKFRIQLLKDMRDASVQSSDEAYLKDAVKGVTRDIQQLETLIDEMLSLHRLDVDPLDYTTELCDLSILLHSVIETYPAQFTGIISEHDVSEHVKIKANPRDIVRLLENLVGNAYKHAATKVSVSLVNEQERVQILVEDDGRGISEADRERIFQPFVRLETGKNRKLSGYGLGLAIVSRVVRLNQLSISVSDSELGGACFRLECLASVEKTEQKGAK